MSVLMTSAEYFADYGRLDRADIIARARAAAQRDRDKADAFLRKPDDEIEVLQFRGLHARRDIVVIPPTNQSDPTAQQAQTPLVNKE